MPKILLSLGILCYTGRQVDLRLSACNHFLVRLAGNHLPTHSLNSACSSLDRDADVSCKNRDGLTALHEAVIRGQASIIEELLHHGAEPHAIISVG